jgi:hypothetical protein
VWARGAQRAVHVNAVNTVARSAPVAAPLILGFTLPDTRPAAGGGHAIDRGIRVLY